MTLAATAPADNVTNATAAWVVLALLAVFAICATLWHHERISDRQTARIDTHDEQLAELAYQMPKLLDWLGIEIPAPVVDDSPEAEEFDPSTFTIEPAPNPTKRTIATVPLPDDPDTDEFPAIPDTEPMAVVDPTPAVQARRAAAWDQQRPSPVPRKSADWVEDAIKGFNFSGRDR